MRFSAALLVSLCGCPLTADINETQLRSECEGRLERTYVALEEYVDENGRLPEDENGDNGIQIFIERLSAQEGYAPSYICNPFIDVGDLKTGGRELVACDPPGSLHPSEAHTNQWIAHFLVSNGQVVTRLVDRGQYTEWCGMLQVGASDSREAIARQFRVWLELEERESIGDSETGGGDVP